MYQVIVDLVLVVVRIVDVLLVLVCCGDVLVDDLTLVHVVVVVVLSNVFAI